MLIAESNCAFSSENLDFTGSARLKFANTFEYEHILLKNLFRLTEALSDEN